MACSALVLVLSLLYLFSGREYHPNQWVSSSTTNESLSSNVQEGELLFIG